MKLTTTIALLAGTLLASNPAFAASDYLLELDGVKGEAAISVESWSFGVCNAGQCSSIVSPRDAASGMATGKRQHEPVRITATQNSQSLRESPSKASDGKTSAPKASWDLATMKGGRTAQGGVTIAAGDLDGDGAADLAFAGTQGEVSGFTLTFQKITVEWRAACTGQHIAQATLRSSSAGDEFVITNAAVTCSGPRQTSGRAAATCADGSCDLAGPVTMTITGGQMKHTKTGHVTLLK